MNKIVKMRFGSHVYGTNTPDSDQDFKSIVIPDYRSILLQKTNNSLKESTKTGSGKNTKDDIDHSLFTLHYWLKLLAEGQTMCLDMLFTPESHWIEESERVIHAFSGARIKIGEYDIFREIQRNSDKFISKQMSSFVGYCQSQAAKYSLKGSNLSAYRLAKDFFIKCDQNAKLHAIRDLIVDQLINPAVLESQYNVKHEPLIKFILRHNTKLDTCEEFLQIGPKTKVPMNAKVCIAYEVASKQFDLYGARAKAAETSQGVDFKALMHAVRVCHEAEELLSTGKITFPRPEAQLLLQIRNGKLHYKEIASIIESGLDKVELAKSTSILPDQPNYKFIEDFIVDVYGKEVVGEF